MPHARFPASSNLIRVPTDVIGKHSLGLPALPRLPTFAPIRMINFRDLLHMSMIIYRIHFRPCIAHDCDDGTWEAPRSAVFELVVCRIAGVPLSPHQ